MMVFSKVLLAYFVLLKKSLGNGSISNDCLLKICRFSSRNNSALRVSPEEVNSINVLLSLQASQPSVGNRFECDAVNLSHSIRCSCRHTTCRVTHIDFSNMNLKGWLPDSIGKLTYLNYLDLSANYLHGWIPISLVDLKQLSYLDLCDNNLEGSVPPFNRDNKKLEVLNLCWNLLYGSFPEGLSELQSLRVLDLTCNNMSGVVLDGMWNMKSLQELYLSNNNLEGQLPQLGNLTNLQWLYLLNNNFSGELPKSIGGLTDLVELLLQGNFIGRIPDVIGELPKLESLMLLGNNFKGPLPKQFSSKNLTFLYISDVSGGEMGNSFPDLRKLILLEHLTLKNCSLSGQIPREVWHLPNLSYLDLSFNNLSGEIPSSLIHKYLKDIYLRGNHLDGLLPGWASNFTGAHMLMFQTIFSQLMQRFLVTPNLLTKTCLHAALLQAMYDHLYINCGGKGTDIDGHYYEADLNPQGRSTFVLSQNLTWGYSSMGKYLTMDSTKENYIVSQTCNISMVDAPLYTQARVAPTSLKYYGFCLKNDNYTVRLHFAEIGWDPTNEDNNHPGTRVFNVEIQGKKVLESFNIEEEAGGLHKSITRNFTVSVTNHRLEIHFYWAGKSSIFVPDYYGPLISAIAVDAVPKNHHKLSPLGIGAIAGSSLFIFVGLIIALLWMSGRLRGKKPDNYGVELYPGGVFNFQQIKEATNNFDITKKIGETGSVFKGVLTDGTEVAVKQLSVKSKQEAQQILTEIGIIYALQHPNLEKPMGCCVRERQVLLVYKYMENLSLQEALFGTDEAVRSKLSWRIRFKICHGIAKGLAFLHEESKLDVIHGNIKPANILLDKDFNVKISGFKYSELHDSQLNKEDTSNVPRAKDTGHMAPEYMQGRPLTPKADVYSFGLVILEIISGQRHMIIRPKEDIFLLNTAYKCYAEDNLEGLIDPSLCEHKDYKYNEVSSILYLAMQCVSPSFDLRPTMSEIVQILEGKKKFKGKRITPSPMIEPVTIPPQSYASGSTSDSQDKQILQESGDN